MSWLFFAVLVWIAFELHVIARVLIKAYKRWVA